MDAARATGANFQRPGGVMRKVICRLVGMCVVALSVAALAQSGGTMKQDTMQQGDQMKHDNMKADNMSTKAVIVSGKVSDDGKMFMSDKDNKNWMISNPETVKGHEGHHVTVKAHLDPVKNEIHVTSVKMAKGEMKDTMKNDNTKKDEMQH
jgi:pentapeptide MXKDX repeat protein